MENIMHRTINYWFKKRKTSDSGKQVDFDCEEVIPNWSIESNTFFIDLFVCLLAYLFIIR